MLLVACAVFVFALRALSLARTMEEAWSIDVSTVDLISLHGASLSVSTVLEPMPHDILDSTLINSARHMSGKGRSQHALCS